MKLTFWERKVLKNTQITLKYQHSSTLSHISAELLFDKYSIGGHNCMKNIFQKMGCCACGDDDKEDHHDIRNGLQKSRGCTDILCCAIYMAFIAFWVFISVTAFQNGNPYQVCTIKNDITR